MPRVEPCALARALDRLPGRLVVLAVEGADFGAGTGLSAPVAAAVDGVVRRVPTQVQGPPAART
jgi:hydrogenase maturation protease